MRYFKSPDGKTLYSIDTNTEELTIFNTLIPIKHINESALYEWLCTNREEITEEGYKILRTKLLLGIDSQSSDR